MVTYIQPFLTAWFICCSTNTAISYSLSWLSFTLEKVTLGCVPGVGRITTFWNSEVNRSCHALLAISRRDKLWKTICGNGSFLGTLSDFCL